MSDVSGVSVVIPTRGERELSGTLDALCAQDTGSFEVLVVENGGTRDRCRDQVHGYADRIECRHFHLSTLGANAARNYGVDRARHSIVAFTDDDCRPAREWISTMAGSFEAEPRARVVGGRTRLVFGSPPPEWLVGAFRHWLSELDWGDSPVFLTGRQYVVSANMGVRREVFDELGGFQTEVEKRAGEAGFLPRNDEIDLQNRIKTSSITGVMYNPCLAVDHQVDDERVDVEWMLRCCYGQGRSDMILNDLEGSASPLDRVQFALERMRAESWFDYMRLPYTNGLEFDRVRYDMYFLQCEAAYWRGLSDELISMSQDNEKE